MCVCRHRLSRPRRTPDHFANLAAMDGYIYTCPRVGDFLDIRYNLVWVMTQSSGTLRGKTCRFPGLWECVRYICKLRSLLPRNFWRHRSSGYTQSRHRRRRLLRDRRPYDESLRLMVSDAPASLPPSSSRVANASQKRSWCRPLTFCA